MASTAPRRYPLRRCGQGIRGERILHPCALRLHPGPLATIPEALVALMRTCSPPAVWHQSQHTAEIALQRLSAEGHGARVVNALRPRRAHHIPATMGYLSRAGRLFSGSILEAKDRPWAILPVDDDRFRTICDTFRPSVREALLQGWPAAMSDAARTPGVGTHGL